MALGSAGVSVPNKPVDKLTFAQQLDLIRNQEIYSKRLDALREAEKDAESAIRKLTKVRDVDRLLADAETKHGNARRALETAAIEAKAARQEADLYVAEKRREANNLIAKARTKVKELDEREAAFAATIEKRKNEAASLEANADSRLQEAEGKEAEIAIREKFVNDAIAVLRKAIAETRMG